VFRHLFSQLLSRSNARNITYYLQCQRLKDASDYLNKLSSPLEIELLWDSDNIFTKVRWLPYSRDQAALKIPANIPKERQEFFINRLIFTLPLMIYYHQSSWFKDGEINLNLDDSADASGLAFCSNRSDSVLIPDPEFIQTKAYERTRKKMQANPIKWEKRLPIVFWRGSSTGVRSAVDWQSIPRVQLHRLIQALGTNEQSYFDVGISSLTQLKEWEKQQFFSDLKLKPFVPLLESVKFRYQIDIDGNSNAWGALFQKLLMGCLVLKVQSPHKYNQWYYSHLETFVHFVPIQPDFSDLFEKVHWVFDHPKEAKQIAENGQRLAYRMTYESELRQASWVIGKELSNH
jgi:hypothetical protein